MTNIGVGTKCRHNAIEIVDLQKTIFDKKTIKNVRVKSGQMTILVVQPQGGF